MFLHYSGLNKNGCRNRNVCRFTVHNADVCRNNQNNLDWSKQQTSKKCLRMRTSHQAIYAHKLFWALGPRGQLHIRDHCAILHHSQAVTVGVDKHLREVVELWDQLLHGDSIDMHFKSCSDTSKHVNKKKQKKNTSEGWLGCSFTMIQMNSLALVVFKQQSFLSPLPEEIKGSQIHS